jgi:hypothetical protein
MPLVYPQEKLDIQKLSHSLSSLVHPAQSRLLPSPAAPQNAPGVWFVACGRATRLNSRLITWLPNLARASLIEALFGTFQYFLVLSTLCSTH